MPANSVNTAFQGVSSNDKCVICLPRQDFLFSRNFLISYGFLEIRGRFYNGFTTFKRRSDMMKIWSDKKSTREIAQ